MTQESQQFICPLGVKRQEHCQQRQLGSWRRTRARLLNRMFVSCVTCDFWLTDEDYNALQADRPKKPLEKPIERFAANL